MGQLPSSRISVCKPFSNVGIYYAGPFLLNLRTGRKPPTIKSYVSLFVCMATRAIHLEWVSDLSTPAFLAALTRFSSRRGLPSHIYCDGGTNFKGARNEMKELTSLLTSTTHVKDVSSHLADKGVEFHVNPASAPHHGDLWEAGVKSTKGQLTRVIGGTHLTVEEFVTLLAEVEATLNSRPLTQMSSDPNDLSFLTPGHFLVGGPIVALPQEDLTDVPQNRLTRWKLVQQMSQHFWKRWEQEYLMLLQSRPKWFHPQPNLAPGILVLIRDNDPTWGPLKWKLGRITNTFPGPDGHVRVCDVQIGNGNIIRRPVVKLSALPIYDE